MTENLIERFLLPLTLSVRPPLLSLEACFLGGLCWPSRPSLLWNHQGATDEIRELLFGEIAVPALAPHLAGDDPYAAVCVESRGEPVEQVRSLILAERSRPANIPEYLHARRSLVDVLPAGARRARHPNVELSTRN